MRQVVRHAATLGHIEGCMSLLLPHDWTLYRLNDLIKLMVCATLSDSVRTEMGQEVEPPENREKWRW